MRKEHKHVKSQLLKKSVIAASLLAVTLSITACSSAPESEPKVEAVEEAAPAKEAGLFTKDIAVCFTNTSGQSVTIVWTEGISSSDGEGTLDGGEIICGEGGAPHAVITYMDGFQTEVTTSNPAFMKPDLGLYSMKPDEQAIQNCNASYSYCYYERERTNYSWSEYTQGQTVNATAEGRAITITRTDDTAWINFSLEIK
ncbi:MAG: hypothetical protein RL720_806 [Actinomycetota bacterium]|jgi:hypothetical protein